MSSSAIKALVRLSCKHRSLSGFQYTASFRGLYNVSRTLHALLSFFFNPLYQIEQNSQGSICVNANCDKCGQTSRLVVGLRYRHVGTVRRVHADFCCYQLVFQHLYYNDMQLQRTNNPIDYMPSYNTMYSHRNVFLHKSLSDASQSSSSRARACSPKTTKRRRNATEYNSIQKDSNVHADKISCLLSSLWHRGYFCHKWITSAIS